MALCIICREMKSKNYEGHDSPVYGYCRKGSSQNSNIDPVLEEETWVRIVMTLLRDMFMM